MSKAKHRKPYRLLDYPFAWYVAQHRNRQAWRKADKRIRKANRRERFEAFMFDLREFLKDG